MTHTPAVRILITLPPVLKQYLADLKRLENRSASGYIQYLLQIDRRMHLEEGWRPKDGWKHRDSPVYQKKAYESWQRFKKWSDRNTLKRAKQIEKEKRTAVPRPAARRPRRA